MAIATRAHQQGGEYDTGRQAIPDAERRRGCMVLVLKITFSGNEGALPPFLEVLKLTTLVPVLSCTAAPLVDPLCSIYVMCNALQ